MVMVMTNDNFPCPIWGAEFEVRGVREVVNRLIRVFDSPRAGGAYRITLAVAKDDIPRLSLGQKARLTTWLIDQRLQGEEQPLITKDIIEAVKARRPIPAYQRADRLLRFIADQSNLVGTPFEIRHEDPAAYAWSESTDNGEIGFLTHYLTKQGWLDSRFRVRLVPFGDYEIPAFVRVTVDGESRIAAQLTNVDFAQAFIAMWFHESTNQALKEGIEPAIEETGYKPFRIDWKEHINKIDDEIIAEIRRSKFLVADFTHGSDGARGGVYYEAGFAYGLDLPVIFTCKNDSVDKLHFDTNHYNHIVWTTPEELREKLKNRILAVIGEGPEADRNA